MALPVERLIYAYSSFQGIVALGQESFQAIDIRPGKPPKKSLKANVPFYGKNRAPSAKSKGLIFVNGARVARPMGSDDNFVVVPVNDNEAAGDRINMCIDEILRPFHIRVVGNAAHDLCF
jgi:hypothetical protein